MINKTSLEIDNKHQTIDWLNLSLSDKAVDSFSQTINNSNEAIFELDKNTKLDYDKIALEMLQDKYFMPRFIKLLCCTML